MKYVLCMSVTSRSNLLLLRRYSTVGSDACRFNIRFLLLMRKHELFSYGALVEQIEFCPNLQPPLCFFCKFTTCCRCRSFSLHYFCLFKFILNSPKSVVCIQIKFNYVFSIRSFSNQHFKDSLRKAVM